MLYGIEMQNEQIIEQLSHLSPTSSSEQEQDAMRCVADGKGNILYVSPALGWALGKQSDSLITDPVSSILKIVTDEKGLVVDKALPEKSTWEELRIKRYRSGIGNFLDHVDTGDSISARRFLLRAEFSLEAPLVYDNALPGASSDPTAGEAAFEMELGTNGITADITAQTVASSFGSWFSVVLTGITPKTIPDMEAERANLINELQTNKAKQVLYDASKAIQDGISEDSLTLEEAGLVSGISVASYDFISRLGKTENGQKLEGLSFALGVATDDLLLKEIFIADPGFDGDVFETTAGGIAAIRVDQIKESAPRPFADVREQALAAWHLKKADEALAVLSNDLVSRASAGESLEDLAKETGDGAEVIETQMIRASRTPGLGNQVIVRLFEARIGQTVRGVAANGLDRVIGQVVTITPNADPIISAITDTLSEQAKQAINADIQQAYHAALLAENPAQTLVANIERTLGVDQ